MNIDESRLTRNYTEQPLGKLEKPTKEDLEYLYLELGLSTVQIGKFFSKGDSSVSRWLIKYNISRNYVPQNDNPFTAEDLAQVDMSRLSRNFTIEPWKPRRDKPVKSDFEYLYLELNWSQKDLSQFFGISLAQIEKILASLNLSKTMEQHQASRERANERKYGTKHTVTMAETRAKIEQTTLENHGVKYLFQKQSFKEETMEAKYGVKHALQKQEFVDKARATAQVSNTKKAIAENYLTETTLQDTLDILYPNAEWVHNKNFLNSLYRPDYCSHKYKVVVEFDGFLHYTDSNTAVRDIEKNKLYAQHGYKCVRIPYFIQLSRETISALFNKDIDIQQVYPHGFISDKVTNTLPSNFCELGLMKFKKDLEVFSVVKSDIISSLRNKIDKLGNVYKVLPPSLLYILD